jgi:peptidoglycan hydrolase-like protein with peptidoglycan-binding domain
LSVDGIVGPLTWAALNQSPSQPPSPSPAPASTAV